MPVIDAANLSQNSITATNMIINTAQWALNLLGLPQFAVAASSFVTSMQQLQAIAMDAQALGFDIMLLQSQLNSLFSLDSAPATSAEFAMRMGEIRVLIVMTYSYAMRTQNTLTTAIETIADALTLINHLFAVVGAVQGTQVLIQYQQQLVLIQSELKVSTTAFQRAKSVEAISEPIMEQSIRNINEAVWSKEP